VAAMPDAKDVNPMGLIQSMLAFVKSKNDFEAETAIERVCHGIITRKWPSPPYGSTDHLAGEVDRMEAGLEGRQTSRYGARESRSAGRRDSRDRTLETVRDVKESLWEAINNDPKIAALARRMGIAVVAAQAGGCTICNHALRVEIDARLRAGDSLGDVVKWAGKDRNTTLARSTLGRHRKHFRTSETVDGTA
jgi:hypothetical protein